MESTTHFELTARELAEKIKQHQLRLVALPERYGPPPLANGQYPRITRVEPTQDHLDLNVVSIEVEDWVGWILDPEETVTVEVA